MISIEINRNRVEISDPGGLPPGMQMEDLGRKSVPRNRFIANMFHRIGEVERVGSGINRMKESMVSSGLPEPRFEVTSFFTIIFDRRPDVTTIAPQVGGFRENFRENFSAKFSVKGAQLERITDIIFRLASGKNIIVAELAREFNVSVRTIHEDLRRLEKWDIVRFEGPPKTENIC